MPFPNPLGEIAGVVPSTSLDYEHSIGHLNKTETDGFEMIATRPLGGYTGSLRGVLRPPSQQTYIGSLQKGIGYPLLVSAYSLQRKGKQNYLHDLYKTACASRACTQKHGRNFDVNKSKQTTGRLRPEFWHKKPGAFRSRFSLLLCNHQYITIRAFDIDHLCSPHTVFATGAHIFYAVAVGTCSCRAAG